MAVIYFDLPSTGPGTWLARETPTHRIEVMIQNDHWHIITSRKFPGLTDRMWCYSTMERALAAVALWDGSPDTEPEGFAARGDVIIY